MWYEMDPETKETYSLPEGQYMNWDAPSRIVGRWEEGDVMVSTVFLGLDHSFSQEGPPVLFETMVFGGPLDQEMERYYTYKQALAGHERMVESVRGNASIVQQTEAEKL